MRLAGYRDDGTLRIVIPGGMTVLLRGDWASPPLDDADAEKLGPWHEPATSLSWLERQELAKRLDRSRMAPAHTFALKFVPFAKKEETEPAPPSPDEPTDVPEPPVKGEATEESAPKTDEKKKKPLSKGDLLKSIQEIAAAQEKEKTAKAHAEALSAAKQQPRSTSKKLKLEYEITDHAGEHKKDDEEKKPEDAGVVPTAGEAGLAPKEDQTARQPTDALPDKKVPFFAKPDEKPAPVNASTPDHLRPYGT